MRDLWIYDAPHEHICNFFCGEVIWASSKSKHRVVIFYIRRFLIQPLLLILLLPALYYNKQVR